MIGFNAIPNNIRVPGSFAEFNNSSALQALGTLPYRVLVLGQKTGTGTWASDSVQRATSPEQVQAGAGRGSMLHRMAKAFFANNRSTEVWFGVLADNGAGVAASGTATVTGPATAAGTINLYIGGTVVQVAVASGDAQNAIAAAINAAINANGDLPVTSAVATNVVTITARNKGTCGNDIDLRLNYQDGEATPAGVAVALVAMANGATNPTLTSLIAALGDNWFQVLALPYTDTTSLTAIETELVSRFGPMRMIDGVAIASAGGTQSGLSTLGDSRNCPHLSIVAQPGKKPLTPPAEFAAQAAAIAAYYAAIDPARPFQTLQLFGGKSPAQGDLFTQQERNLMLYDGISTSRTAAGGVIQLERLITTYQTSASGAADVSYLDVTTMLTLLYLRWSFRTLVQNKFPRHKLADDGTRFGAGQPIVTPLTAKALAIAWYEEVVLAGLAEGLEEFKANVIVERDAADRNGLNFQLPVNIANQLVVSRIQIQFFL